VSVPIAIDYEKWNGRPFVQLPLLEQLRKLSRRISKGGGLSFEWIEYGEHREILSVNVEVPRSVRFRQAAHYLDLLSKLSDVCRQIGSRATYSHIELIDVQQQRDIALAYALTQKPSILCKVPTYTFSPPTESRPVLKALLSGTLELRMPLCLSFGKTSIGEVPLKVAISDFSITENVDDTISLQPRSPGVMSLDLPVVASTPA
jgi:hypothetical protein